MLIIKNIVRLTICILTIIQLNACTTVPKPQPTKTNLHYLSWTDRKAQLRMLDNWHISGSLSITYNNKTDLASFDWQKNHDVYTINIYGPMNLASAKIMGNANHVTLQKSSGEKTEASTAEELMQHQLGWALPVNNLNYWIRGLPTPGINARSVFDDYNHLSSIAQQEWQIIYVSYDSFANIDLPTKIYLNSPQLHAKIVIKRW
jgi:outer membrane lipoprotein LolB